MVALTKFEVMALLSMALSGDTDELQGVYLETFDFSVRQRLHDIVFSDNFATEEDALKTDADVLKGVIAKILNEG